MPDRAAISPPAAEGFVCETCAISYADTSVGAALACVASVPQRVRYNERSLDAVLAEMAANAAGFGDEAARFSAEDWERTASRPPGETRSARWMVRQVRHEGEHHLRDIRRVGGAAAAHVICFP